MRQGLVPGHMAVRADAATKNACPRIQGQGLLPGIGARGKQPPESPPRQVRQLQIELKPAHIDPRAKPLFAPLDENSYPTLTLRISLGRRRLDPSPAEGILKLLTMRLESTTRPPRERLATWGAPWRVAWQFRLLALYPQALRPRPAPPSGPDPQANPAQVIYTSWAVQPLKFR